MGSVLIASSVLMTFPKVSAGGRVCEASRRGQGKRCSRFTALGGAGGCRAGESWDGHTSRNYSSFAKPKLNPTLPLSLPSARLLSLSLFWLIHNRGSESYWSNSGLIPGERDGTVEGWILPSFESGHVLCQKITWNALCPALGRNI